jgi:hypothetical protein
MKKQIISGLIVACLSATAQAQSLEQRIDSVRAQREQAAAMRTTPTADMRIPQRMRQLIESVDLSGVAARTAFDWWSKSTGIPLLIDWDAMEREGVDAELPIDLHLKQAPASVVLRLMMRLTSSEFNELIVEVEPWYVQVMTKEQANRQRVVRVYEVSDLLVDVPHFSDAPAFDLNEVLSSSGTAEGGGGRGSTSLFVETEQQVEPMQTRQGRGEDLAQLIRDVIEPGIWQENGGFSSVRYHRGMLIVNAPMYVQRQIGMPTRTPGAAVVRPRAGAVYRGDDRDWGAAVRSGSTGISGTNPVHPVSSRQ